MQVDIKLSKPSLRSHGSKDESTISGISVRGAAKKWDVEGVRSWSPALGLQYVDLGDELAA